MRFAPMKPTPRGLWRRTPPAVFPSILGLLGMGIGWRRAAAGFGLPAGIAEAVLGAVTLYALFALLAYAVKVLRRPGAVADDLRILPGRAGLCAAVLCIYLLALVLAPYTGAARGLFWAGVAAHLGLAALILRGFATGPAEQRRVSPVWHLLFAGWSVAALAAQGLGLAGIAVGLFWVSLVAAVTIWVVSIGQAARERVPAPLRPLLAIHLAPAAVLGSVATGFGAGALATVFAVGSALAVVAMAVRVRWLTAAGISPLWGAFTFPLAATAGFWILRGGLWQAAGGGLLAVATVVCIFVAVRTGRMWADGQLAVKTNAAIA